MTEIGDWRVTKLTEGSDVSRYHSHSYYDIPVFDAGGERIAAHRMTMQGRPMRPDDAIDVGIVHASRPGEFEPLAQTTAWSWQQGPLAQWVAGGPEIMFNARIDGEFRAQIVDASSGATRYLPRSAYAAAPDGQSFYGLDMRRLEHLRPGYGYATGERDADLIPAPRDNGVWRMDRAGKAQLIVSIAAMRDCYVAQASMLERLRHRASGYIYWLNHLKLSPDGSRFTVKLRWRRAGGGWSDRQSVSMTGGIDGTGIGVLRRGLSHVMWLNDAQLYAWNADRLELIDDAAAGTKDDCGEAPIAPGLIRQNVHLRHLPPGASDAISQAVFDTPYRENVDLIYFTARCGPGSGESERIARFTGHVPATGPLRCDLHPCPSPDGSRIVVTSIEDGGRQIYLIERKRRN